MGKPGLVRERSQFIVIVFLRQCYTVILEQVQYNTLIHSVKAFLNQCVSLLSTVYIHVNNLCVKDI